MATRVGDLTLVPAVPMAPRLRAFLVEPFRVTGTELPESVLLLTKVIALAFIATGQIRLLSWHFLPFFSVFDKMGSPAVFHWSLVTIFLIAATALFYNKYVRFCCLILGSVILISLFSSRLYFENNRTYCACILILAGLCTRGRSPWPIRSQVVLVYFGAALNKLFDQDWRTGQFFAYWFGQIHHPKLWLHITGWIPAMPLAQFICWTTIITEFVLVVGFLAPRFYSWAIWLGAAYHTALLVVMNSTFGMFYYAMLASYLAFVAWPERPGEVLYDDGCSFDRTVMRFFRRIDTAASYIWVPLRRTQTPNSCAELPTRPLLVEDNKLYCGFAALKRMLLFNPLAYFCYAILLGRQPRLFQYHRWLAAAVLVIFTPFLESWGQAAYRWIARAWERFSPKARDDVSEQPGVTVR